MNDNRTNVEGRDVNHVAEPRSPLTIFEKHLPRVQNVDNNKKTLVSKDDKRAGNKLPAHMHSVHNRMGMSNLLERSLRETQY